MRRERKNIQWVGVFFILLFLALCCSERESGTDDFERGKTLYNQQRLDEALVYFERVISNNRKHKQAYVMAAKCYYFLDRETVAIQMLEKILRQFPDYVDANFWLGKLYYFDGEYERAEKHLLGVIAEDSGHIDARYILGDIYLYEGSFEKALLNYGIVEESIGIAALSKIRQGEIFVRSKQYGKAQEELAFIERNKDLLDYHVLDEAYALLSRIGADE